MEKIDKMITLSMHESDVMKLRKIADESGMSMSALVRYWANKYYYAKTVDEVRQCNITSTK